MFTIHTKETGELLQIKPGVQRYIRYTNGFHKVYLKLNKTNN